MIRTVCGDISSSEVGHAQCHEHIWLPKGASWRINPVLCMDDYSRSLKELQDYYQAGGRLIIDAQPGGCGRDTSVLRRLSEESRVLIVATAGFHKKEFFDDIGILSPSCEELTDLFVREVMESIDGIPNSRAGILKIALDTGRETDPVCRKLSLAVAQAAVQTSAPVMVHTEKGNDILALVRWFEMQGVSPEKLLICHLDRTHYDAKYHEAVLSTGCTLCYDSIHRLKYVSETEELDLLCRMKEAGFTEQIVLSLDTTNQRLRAYEGTDMGLDYILETYIPKLLDRGFTENEIHKMCVTNARRILDFITE